MGVVRDSTEVLLLMSSPIWITPDDDDDILTDAPQLDSRQSNAA